MIRYNTPLFMALVVLLAGAGCGSKETSGTVPFSRKIERPPVTPDVLDANRRHKQAGAWLARFDSDKDGRVSKAEFVAARTRPMAQNPENKGRVDLGKIQAGIFDRLDFNKDGFLSIKEMSSQVTKPVPATGPGGSAG